MLYSNLFVHDLHCDFIQRSQLVLMKLFTWSYQWIFSFFRMPNQALCLNANTVCRVNCTRSTRNRTVFFLKTINNNKPQDNRWIWRAMFSENLFFNVLCFEKKLQMISANIIIICKYWRVWFCSWIIHILNRNNVVVLFFRTFQSS